MWDILACSLLPVPIKKPVWLMCHYNHRVVLSNLHNFKVAADQLNLETKILATTSKRYSGNICGYLSKYKAKGAKSLRQQRIFANIFCLFMNESNSCYHMGKGHASEEKCTLFRQRSAKNLNWYISTSPWRDKSRPNIHQPLGSCNAK